MTGSEAFRLGLAEVEVSAEAVLKEARGLAERLAALPVASIQATKRFFREQIPVAGLVLSRELRGRVGASRF